MVDLGESQGLQGGEQSLRHTMGRCWTRAAVEVSMEVVGTNRGTPGRLPGGGDV